MLFRYLWNKGIQESLLTDFPFELLEEFLHEILFENLSGGETVDRIFLTHATAICSLLGVNFDGLAVDFDVEAFVIVNWNEYAVML